MDVKNLEESKPGFTKNWVNEKNQFEILASKVSKKWKNWSGLRRCELTNSPGMNWEKVTLQCRSSLHKCTSCREEWIKQAVIENFKIIDWSWKIIPRSQSTDSRSKSLWDAEKRPTSAIWYMEFAWYIGKSFWQSTCSNRFVIDTLSRNASLLESKCHRRKPSAR